MGVKPSLQRCPLLPTWTLYSLLLTFALISASSPAFAQPPDITVNTPATSDQIQSWLYSTDPRLIAWGAHFARERHSRPALGYMAQLLASHPADLDYQTTLVILDGLIDQDITVPANTIGLIASRFPSQAAILAARLPLTDSTPLLLDWYARRAGKDYTPLPRVAAMLLSHGPPPGFAATVLSESEETLHISVIAKPGPGSGTYAGISCGTGGAPPPRSAWPPVFTYALTDGPHTTTLPVLVEAAGDRIYYIRRDIYKGSSCRGSASLNAINRHHLLAQMLSVTDEQMPWKSDTSQALLCHNNAQCVGGAMAIVAREEGNLNATVKALEAKGLLTSEESATVRPALHVGVSDMRGPNADPLPQLTFADQRTTLAH